MLHIVECRFANNFNKNITWYGILFFIWNIIFLPPLAFCISACKFERDWLLGCLKFFFLTESICLPMFRKVCIVGNSTLTRAFLYLYADNVYNCVQLYMYGIAAGRKNCVKSFWDHSMQMCEIVMISLMEQLLPLAQGDKV